jgi:hypothetical protein
VGAVVEALHHLHGALAGGLADGVKEHQDEVHVLRQPQDGLLHVKGVLQGAGTGGAGQTGLQG